MLSILAAAEIQKLAGMIIVDPWTVFSLLVARVDICAVCAHI
jgi:hypothetical protein